jgi:Flp pilus assembly protein TadG
MLGRILLNSSGAAAAELALIAPMLALLMFGSMELGYYFYSEHVLIKAVRDGARFASRESFDDFTCPSTIDPTVVTETQQVTRTNTVDGTGTPRLPHWTNNSSVQVTLTCDTSGNFANLFYQGLAGGVPVVKVSATVPYTSIFGLLGLGSSSLQLQAKSQVSVMGQ